MPVDILTRIADAKAAGTMPLRPPQRRRKAETALLRKLTRPPKPRNGGRS